MTALLVAGVVLLAAGLIAANTWIVAVGATLLIATIIYDVTRHDDESAD